MSSRRALSLLALTALTLGALGIALFLSTDRGERPRADDRSQARTAPERPAESAPGPAELLGAPRPAEPTPAAVLTDDVPAASGREVARTDYERELEDAVWIEGRVVFPPGTPAAAAPRVRASGRRFQNGPFHEVAVDANGRFRVAVSPKTRTAKLTLQDAWLYLPAPHEVKVAEAPETVLLEPALGGRMVGTVAPGGGVARERLVGAKVRLAGELFLPGKEWTSGLFRTVELNEDLAFAFDALPIEGEYELLFNPGFTLPVVREGLTAIGGEEEAFTLEAVLGATLEGVVVDTEGQPVDGAYVEARIEDAEDWSDAHERSAAAELDGTFRIEGIAAGEVLLVAEAEGFDPVEVAFGEIALGATAEGARIVMGRGLSIDGVVRWPDGEIAPGVTVTATPVQGEFWDSLEAQSDEEGRFELSGLAPGGYRLDATAMRKWKVTVKSELTGKERQKTVRTRMVASALDVAVGTRGVVLDLSEGRRLAGAVIDDRGAPVERFSVTYGPYVRDPDFTTMVEEGHKAFRDAGGAFELTGLRDGELGLAVTAKGYVQGPEVVVELPSAAALGPIRLQRTATLAGSVVAATGEPVPDAEVHVTVTGDWSGFQADTWVLDVDGEISYGVELNSDGEFEFEAPPARVTLFASAPGYASAEPIILKVSPGGRVDGVVISLGSGARLSGVVLRADGSPAPRRLVDAYSDELSEAGSTYTDDAGAFEITGLTPGFYELEAAPTHRETQESALGKIDGVYELLVARGSVDLTEAGAHVVLRPPALQPIRLHGTVRVNGEPSRAKLWLYENEQDLDVETSAGKDGRYEVLVPGPGLYLGDVTPVGGGDDPSSVPIEVEVTESRDQRVDFDLRTGSIAGRVSGPDGPIEDATIQAMRTLGPNGEPGDGWAVATTDARGEYTLEHLAVGTWDLVADADMLAYSGGPILGQARRSGLVVGPEEDIQGVDFELGPAGSLAGIVLDSDGAPVDDAAIFVRAATGELVEDWGSGRSDEDGTFELVGIGAGTYTIGASGGGEVSPSELPVEVRAGVVTKVELRLEAGTLLMVEMVDADGETSASGLIECFRADGTDVSGWYDWNHGFEWANTRRHFGPLAPGEYLVVADREGSLRQERKVRLSGEAELELQIEMP